MRAGVLGALAVLSACGGGGDDTLSETAVTSIPAGDATGSALGGTYDVNIRVTDCAGDCTVSGLAFCDIGDVTTGEATVSHTDGRLELDVSSDFVVSHFEGAAFADGGFDVGGVATEGGGAVRITARGTGTIDASGELDGTVRARGRGAVGGDGISCTATYAATGSRR